MSTHLPSWYDKTVRCANYDDRKRLMEYRSDIVCPPGSLVSSRRQAARARTCRPYPRLCSSRFPLRSFLRLEHSRDGTCWRGTVEFYYHRHGHVFLRRCVRHFSPRPNINTGTDKDLR